MQATFNDFIKAIEEGNEKNIVLVSNGGLKARIICTNKKGRSSIVTLTDVGEYERVESFIPESIPTRFSIYINN